MGGSVLIVDDEPSCGRLLAVLIRHMGHQADYVESGGKALEYLSQRQPDLVILDVMMPDIDGVEVLQRMRSNPETSQVPVVMFSALSDPGFLHEVRQLGANDYWIKATLDFRSLEQRLDTYLSADPHPN